MEYSSDKLYTINYKTFTMFSYESLDIWKLSVSYARRIYIVTSNFPKSEIYSLVSQLRRAAVSISSNIAEGSGATSLKDKLNYLDIAIKSALETTSEIQIAFELEFISKEIRDELYKDAEIIIRKIRSFKTFLKNDKQ